MITIDDFVMLGKTVPEPKSDGRVFVCSAGYSATLRQLIRIYPLSRYEAPPRWSISTITLDRNPQDSRAESYRIAGDEIRREHHDDINRAFQMTGTVPASQRAQLLKRCVLPSIAEANKRIAGYGKDRTSLAILHAEQTELIFKYNPESPDSPQLSLFDDGRPDHKGAKRFPYIPHLHFRDEAGNHNLSLREWGVFELMRKHDNLTAMSETERRKYVTDALHLNPGSSLLVGNQANARTAWLVISVLNGLREEPALFDVEAA